MDADLAQIVTESLKTAIPDLLDSVEPILMPIIISGIGGLVVWYFVKRSVCFFSYISGDSKRITKSKVRKVKGIFDFVLTFRDLCHKK
jgi:hypothetical protein